jgi:anti-sigma regulatory factor (Ser/Thr protein kinase)
MAREGRMLLLPPEERELKRVVSALAEDLRESTSGDSLFSGLQHLEASFRWKTSAFEVSLVCRRVAKMLADSGFYPDRASEDECALALEEALVNSTEHGNLELDSSLRPDSPLDEDQYEAERARRSEDPAYGDRLVRLHLSISRPEARIVLEDEGAGFDTSKVDDSPSGLDVSGKGFWLIKRPFDAASYNDKGNSLTLIRRRRGHGYRA